MPELHRDDLREMLHGNYRIVYRLLDDVVEILTVHHSARVFDPAVIDPQHRFGFAGP
ncbi:MAG: type II toxin-antitoxin system RelE/ParE family toxin [Spirochaetaceae bacterium]|nr:MAG: type II toxin-antitoxin system RelE/ParE family toxin [Spirochaetaceae bacterium]